MATKLLTLAESFVESRDRFAESALGSILLSLLAWAAGIGLMVLVISIAGTGTTVGFLGMVLAVGALIWVLQASGR